MVDAAVPSTGVGAQEAAAEPHTVEVARDMLSRHVVTAVFAGVEPGKEPMLMIYPPMPAKEWAKFDVVEVHEFEKPGQYGDQVEAGGNFAFVPDEATPEIQAQFKTLAPGDRVKLAWRHDYVTKETTMPDGKTGTNKSPERPVTLLEKL